MSIVSLATDKITQKDLWDFVKPLWDSGKDHSKFGIIAICSDKAKKAAIKDGWPEEAFERISLEELKKIL